METKLKRPMSFLLALVVAMVFNFPIGVTSGIKGIFNFGMPAKAAGTIEPTQPSGSGTSADPYLIGTKEELYWFAAQVNSGKNTKNAKLTADIKVNDIFIDANGNLTGDIPWTPIGNQSNQYTGTFDGDGHTISGLYLSNTTQYYVGLFGYLGTNGKIKNVGVIDSYFNGKSYVGGVCGYNSSGSITSCYNTRTVSGSGNMVGGVCGYNSSGSITSCYNTGAVSGSVDNPDGGNNVGGVCGYSNHGTVKNCYNTGTVSGWQYVGGVSGKNDGGSVIESCYSTGAVTGTTDVGGVCGKNSSSTITNCYYLDSTKSDRYATSKTAAQFGSGEVCYLLNGSTSESSESKKLAWGQTLTTDASPVFYNEKNTVYYGYTTCDVSELMQYTNEKVSSERPAHTENGSFNCSVCNVALVDITGFSTNYSKLNDSLTQAVFEVKGDGTVEPTTITVKGGSNIITVYFNIDGNADLVESYTLTVKDSEKNEENVVQTVTSQYKTIFANIGMAQLVHTLPDGTYNVSITLNAANGDKITKTETVTVSTSSKESAA